MEKPNSMTMKTFLIKKVSSKLTVSQLIVTDVINHQFKNVLKSFRDCKSVEISDFGKFLFNEKRGVKALKAFEGQATKFKKIIESSKCEDEVLKAKKGLEENQFNVEYLKEKLE